MASFIRRRGPRGETAWQARVERKGWPRQYATFSTKAEAEQWASVVESEMARGVFISRTEAENTTLADALRRYESEVSARKRGARQEESVIGMLHADPIAKTALARVRSSDVARMIERWRAAGYAPATIHRRLALLSHLFEIASRSWGMESLINPVRRVQRPKLNNGRDRRLLAGEEPRLIAACEAYGGPIADLVSLALGTAMRRGELALMRWEHLDRRARVLLVPETKTGVPRRVPLSSRALAVLDALPRRIDGYVWGVRADSITQAFGRAVTAGRRGYEAECRAASENPDPRMLAGLRFHDLRHEATSRLFEKGLNPMQVSAITGHKTLVMLQRYTHLRAEDLVGLLG